MESQSLTLRPRTEAARLRLVLFLILQTFNNIHRKRHCRPDDATDDDISSSKFTRLLNKTVYLRKGSRYLDFTVDITELAFEFVHGLHTTSTVPSGFPQPLKNGSKIPTRERDRERDWREPRDFRSRRSPIGRARSPNRDFRDRDRDGPLGVDADRSRRGSRDGGHLLQDHHHQIPNSTWRLMLAVEVSIEVVGEEGEIGLQKEVVEEDHIWRIGAIATHAVDLKRVDGEGTR
ncbi:hypothetical protein NXS19_000394 [Fusarium pseudograminearum]|nr:hypothetical protein NXS19_000394 [Fusarium pseudograminearum]